jgi:hypothetical protein
VAGSPRQANKSAAGISERIAIMFFLFDGVEINL